MWMKQENLMSLLLVLLVLSVYKAGGHILGKPGVCPSGVRDGSPVCTVSSTTFPITMLCNATVKQIVITKMMVKDKYGNVGVKKKPPTAQAQCHQTMKATPSGSQCQLTDPKTLKIPELSDVTSITVEYLCGESITE